MNELEEIRSRIYEIRGQKVMLDMDLAELYGVETSQLKRTVRRNIERFPDDFMFSLTLDEFKLLKSSMGCQNGISKKGGAQYVPFAFTEQGVAMLSGVLRSQTAIQVNIRIMRAFVAVRQYLSAPLCTHCHVESEVHKLKAYIEEILADQNDFNEDINHALALLQAAVFTDSEDVSEKRIFTTTVKGFRPDEQ